jgi:hypothetical protein
MNDGAGMDMFEEKYLLGDSVGMSGIGDWSRHFGS